MAFGVDFGTSVLALILGRSSSSWNLPLDLKKNLYPAMSSAETLKKIMTSSPTRIENLLLVWKPDLILPSKNSGIHIFFTQWTMKEKFGLVLNRKWPSPKNGFADLKYKETFGKPIENPRVLSKNERSILSRLWALFKKIRSKGAKSLAWDLGDNLARFWMPVINCFGMIPSLMENYPEVSQGPSCWAIS